MSWHDAQPRCAWCGRLINRAHITFKPEGTPFCVRRRMWHPAKCGDILLADELTDRNAEPKTHPPLGKTGNPEDTP